MLKNSPRKKQTKTYNTRRSTNTKDKIKFAQFIKEKKFIEALSINNIIYLSDIQKSCLPHALLGLDLICQAKSGMGKTTLAIIIVLAQIKVNSDVIQSLFITPNRELSQQIYDSIKKYIDADHLIKSFCIIGGIDKKTQQKKLCIVKPNIIIGTPGRIHEIIISGTLDCSKVRYLIIDECDKIFENLRSKIQIINFNLPVNKQVLLLSATLPAKIRKICRKYTNDALEILIDDNTKFFLSGQEQYYLRINEIIKIRLLIKILNRINDNQILLFVNSIKRGRSINRILINFGFKSVCIHSRMNQKNRFKTLDMFKNNYKTILIATDLASRGWDLPTVNAIINFDMPYYKKNIDKSSVCYLHRLGRIGRFGNKGLVINLITKHFDWVLLKKIKKKYKINIKKVT